MPNTAQVTCINKTNRYDAHERIQSIGGYAGGSAWKLSQADAIVEIESGRWAFYVAAGGRSVWVIVALSRYRHKYLKTESDGEQPDNLLSLPECP
jgi:hypothetical protein